MTTIEFQILDCAREWQPSRITADEIACKLHGWPVPRGKAQGIGRRARSLVDRGLLTAERCDQFNFYQLTPKAEAILDA